MEDLVLSSLFLCKLNLVSDSRGIRICLSCPDPTLWTVTKKPKTPKRFLLFHFLSLYRRFSWSLSRNVCLWGRRHLFPLIWLLGKTILLSCLPHDYDLEHIRVELTAISGSFISCSLHNSLYSRLSFLTNSAFSLNKGELLMRSQRMRFWCISNVHLDISDSHCFLLWFTHEKFGISEGNVVPKHLIEARVILVATSDLDYWINRNDEGAIDYI